MTILFQAVILIKIFGAIAFHNYCMGQIVPDARADTVMLRRGYSEVAAIIMQSCGTSSYCPC